MRRVGDAYVYKLATDINGPVTTSRRVYVQCISTVPIPVLSREGQAMNGVIMKFTVEGLGIHVKDSRRQTDVYQIFDASI